MTHISGLVFCIQLTVHSSSKFILSIPFTGQLLLSGQWFSKKRRDFAPWGHLATSGDILGCHKCVFVWAGGRVSGGRYWHLVDGGQRMLLRIPQCLGQPLLQEATEVEKPCLRGREGILDFLVAITHAQRKSETVSRLVL